MAKDAVLQIPYFSNFFLQTSFASAIAKIDYMFILPLFHILFNSLETPTAVPCREKNYTLGVQPSMVIDCQMAIQFLLIFVGYL